MSAPREPRQRSARVGLVPRLSKYLGVENDDGVRRDDEIIPIQCGDGLGFLAREPFGVTFGQLARQWKLIDVSRPDGVGEADELQQITAPG